MRTHLLGPGFLQRGVVCARGGAWRYAAYRAERGPCYTGEGDVRLIGSGGSSNASYSVSHLVASKQCLHEQHGARRAVDGGEARDSITEGVPARSLPKPIGWERMFQCQ